MNEYLFKQNEQVDQVYILSKGQVKLYKKEDYDYVKNVKKLPANFKKNNQNKLNIDLALLTDNQLIGEEFLFKQNADYSAKVISQKCTLYSIEKEKLLYLFEEYEEIKETLSR